MSDQSEIKKEMEERLRLAGVTIPPGREEATLNTYVELRGILKTLREWVPPPGQMPAEIFRVAPKARRNG